MTVKVTVVTEVYSDLHHWRAGSLINSTHLSSTFFQFFSWKLIWESLLWSGVLLPLFQKLHTQFKWDAKVKYQMVEPGVTSSSLSSNSPYSRSRAFFITVIIRVHVYITTSCRQREGPWLLLVVIWFAHYLKYSFHLQERLCSNLEGYF